MSRRSLKGRLRPPSCRHKNHYSNRQMAEEARQKQQERYGWLLKYYVCRHCGEYHLSRVKDGGKPIPIAGWQGEEE